MSSPGERQWGWENKIVSRDISEAQSLYSVPSWDLGGRKWKDRVNTELAPWV